MEFDRPEDRRRFLQEMLSRRPVNSRPLREFKVPPKRPIPRGVQRAMLAQYNAGPRRHGSLTGVTDVFRENPLDAAKRAYIEGRIEIDEFETRVDAALRAGCPF